MQVRVRRRRSPWVATIVLVVCALALPLANVPTVAASVIHCCCGDHDATHACDCVDCPANHHGELGHDATVKSCSRSSVEVTLANTVAVLPPIVAPVRDLATPAVAAPPPAFLDRLAEPPPSPPPRG